MGAQSASMGQAGVAGPATDGSSYLNPAALATVDGDLLSLSTTVGMGTLLRLEQRPSEYEDWDVSRDLDKSDTVFVPTAIAYARAWGKAIRFAAGLSVVVPVFDSYAVADHDRAQKGLANLTGFIVNDASRRGSLKRLLVGPSFALGITRLRLTVTDVKLPDPPELRVGVALQLGTMVELRADLVLTIFTDDPHVGTYSQTWSRFRSGKAPSTDALEFGQLMAARTTVNGSVGARLRLSPRWSLALGLLTDLSSTGDYWKDGETWQDRLRWPKQDRYLGTVGGSYNGTSFSIHGGVSAGVSLYESREFMRDGTDATMAAPVLRFFIGGGMNTAEALRALL